jgi:hypothetical protein
LWRPDRATRNEVPIREFKTACQQACPSDSLVFGNINDPQSRVSRLRQSERTYVTLKYLNTEPRVSYLARIKNPNPKMPGANKVGKANGEPRGHGSTPEGSSQGHGAAEHQEEQEEAHH